MCNNERPRSYTSSAFQVQNRVSCQSAKRCCNEGLETKTYSLDSWLLEGLYYRHRIAFSRRQIHSGQPRLRWFCTPILGFRLFFTCLALVRRSLPAIRVAGLAESPERRRNTRPHSFSRRRHGDVLDMPIKKAASFTPAALFLTSSFLLRSSSFYNVLLLRSQLTKPTPIPPSIRAAGAGITTGVSIIP